MTVTERVLERLTFQLTTLAEIERAMQEQLRQPFPQRRSRLIEFLGIERARTKALIQELHLVLESEPAGTSGHREGLPATDVGGDR